VGWPPLGVEGPACSRARAGSWLRRQAPVRFSGFQLHRPCWRIAAKSRGEWLPAFSPAASPKVYRVTGSRSLWKHTRSLKGQDPNNIAPFEYSQNATGSSNGLLMATHARTMLAGARVRAPRPRTSRGHAIPTPPLSGAAANLAAPPRGVAPRAAGDDDDFERADKRRVMEDELKDPGNFLEYFLPRPIRLTVFGFSAASCLIGTVIAAAQALSPAVALGGNPGQTAAIDLVGAAVFGAIFVSDLRGQQKRIERRAEVKRRQIEFGDREVFVNQEGERMSKLKEVDDDWILRRLERFGKRDNMPYVGPRKGAALQGVLRDARPRHPVEVGTMCAYSAILLARVLEDLDREDGREAGAEDLRRLVTIEKDLAWYLVARRYLWQCSQGAANAVPGARLMRLGDRVDVRLGEATRALGEWEGEKIDFLFLDGTPGETLGYLRAAEPHLAPGCVVVADNAGVFAEGGMKPYLDYVRGDAKYSSSRFIESTFDFREDVRDGLEVSVFAG